MKFIAALIATAAAVKTHDDQWEADPADLGLESPTLTAAAQALADTQVADVSTLEGIAALSPEEAVDLALWCTLEDACADNFEEVVGAACFPDDGTDPLPECAAVEAMMYGLEDVFEMAYGDGWGSSSDPYGDAGYGSGYGSSTDSDAGYGSGYGSSTDSDAGYGSGYGSSTDSGAGGDSDSDSYGSYGVYGTETEAEFNDAWNECADDYPDYGRDFDECLSDMLGDALELAQETSNSEDESSSHEPDSITALSLAQDSDSSSSGDGSSSSESSALLAQTSVDSNDIYGSDTDFEGLTLDLAQEDSGYGSGSGSGDGIEELSDFGSATEAALALCDDLTECVDLVLGSVGSDSDSDDSGSSSE